MTARSQGEQQTRYFIQRQAGFPDSLHLRGGRNRRALYLSATSRKSQAANMLDRHPPVCTSLPRRSFRDHYSALLFIRIEEIFTSPFVSEIPIFPGISPLWALPLPFHPEQGQPHVVRLSSKMPFLAMRWRAAMLSTALPASDERQAAGGRDL